jgi:hypothetical protein
LVSEDGTSKNCRRGIASEASEARKRVLMGLPKPRFLAMNIPCYLISVDYAHSLPAVGKKMRCE